MVRSKGWVSLDRFAPRGVYWTHAGRHFGLEIAPEWKTAEAEADLGVSSGDAGAPGDEGGGYQEIVFIGMGMDEAAIREALDDCLLTDAELAQWEARRQEKVTRRSEG